MTAVLLHELPGRLRVSLGCLRHDSRRAAALRDRLARLPGVISVSASPLTGSVLVRHDGHPATRQGIVAGIEGFGDATARMGTKLQAPVHTGEPRPDVHPLTRSVVEKFLEHLLGAVISGVI